MSAWKAKVCMTSIYYYILIRQFKFFGSPISSKETLSVNLMIKFLYCAWRMAHVFTDSLPNTGKLKKKYSWLFPKQIIDVIRTLYEKSTVKADMDLWMNVHKLKLTSNILCRSVVSTRFHNYVRIEFGWSISSCIRVQTLGSNRVLLLCHHVISSWQLFF